jgi:hypothetical protein
MYTFKLIDAILFPILFILVAFTRTRKHGYEWRYVWDLRPAKKVKDDNNR